MQSKGTFHLLLVLIVLFTAVPVYCQSPAKDARGEKLAGVAYGDSISTVTSVLGRPDRKSRTSKPVESDSFYHEYYSYPSKGITVEFADDKVYRMELTAPGRGATARGIRIGDPESLVTKSYVLADALGRETKKIRADERVYCGIPENGLLFIFDRAGKLKKIGLGNFWE
ncbi:MAG: hypothetical protein AB2L14_06775 [Candidatus Xenobiia bacterium LiM19]